MASALAAPHNRLAASANPYLRAHAADPVHWQPWDAEALACARASGRPILLSIGFAACHWCHVMARESFSDPVTAGVMNAHFVCIKVDREERPDLDRYFLAALARMGQAAGWPLTAFLTHEAVLCGGGGYYPPEPRFGLPAFCDVLQRMAAPVQGGQKAGEPQARPRRHGGSDIAVPRALLDRVARGLADSVDALYGGFGMSGPKFLHPAGHELLLRAWDRTGDNSFLRAAAGSARHICNGGVFDHVGGGFHRYATDDCWRSPHFEKMLDVNSLMLRLATQSWQATGDALFAGCVAATAGWLLRDMRLPSGAFAASTAADSAGPDGSLQEGRYFLWTEDELRETLGPAYPAFLHAYEAAGQGREDARCTLLRREGVPAGEDEDGLRRSLERLRQARMLRPAPRMDGKCLADWNGLAVAALVGAGVAFQRPDWVAAARAAYAGVLAEAAAGHRLAHCAVAGVPSSDGLLDDYAAMAQAALGLYQATMDEDYLRQAAEWVQHLDREFWDEAAGGYFLTEAGADPHIPRQKFITESSAPAGNATMLGVLAQLCALTGQDRYRSRFDGILRCFAGEMSRAGLHAATALCNCQAMADMTQVVIVGTATQTPDLFDAAVRRFLPDSVILRSRDDDAGQLGQPAFGKAAVDGVPTAYVCHGVACLPPAFTPNALADRLSAHTRRQG